jgi:hypothetical protein
MIGAGGFSIMKRRRHEPVQVRRRWQAAQGQVTEGR